MLRRGKADQGSLIALKECATLGVEPDDLSFLADSVVAEEITKVIQHVQPSNAKHARGVSQRRDL
jgi:hypothetical protein